LGSLLASVGLAFDDKFVAGGDEPVNGATGRAAGRSSRRGIPRVAVAGDHGRGLAVPLDDELVEVAVSTWSIVWRAKLSRMSSSRRASLRISASTVVSSRAALRRRRSWSARLNSTERRRRIAMCPSAVAR
jgi:hypothetical protein